MSSATQQLPNLTSATATGNSPSSAASNTGNSNTATATGTSTQGSQSAGTATGLPTIGASSTDDSSSAASVTDAPTLTSTNVGGILSLPGLPTLTGGFSYPAASVPPTSNAPYMSQSNLPQNFVFIVVGGVLAFILLLVMLWRFLTAWSINRSFKKDSAAMYTPLPDLKKKPIKSESGMDMADLSSTAKLPKSFNSVPSLFFSPTAEVARQSMIRPQSQHMPGGHYRDASRG